MQIKTKIKCKTIFITGTDTGVGKTIATFVLGALLQKQGLNVGVMKPVQCSGDDALFLKESLNLKNAIETINPFYAKEPLSPHLAFARENKEIDINQIKKRFDELTRVYDVVLVEGAGGLLVPIKEDYLVADLASDLDCELVIVSRLGLGSINHTLMTVEAAKQKGIKISGIVFSEASPQHSGIPEQTNPDIIREYSQIPVLGTIPYLKKMDKEEVIRQCEPTLRIDSLLSETKGTFTDQYQAWDKSYVWHPFTQMKDWEEDTPLVIERAQGNYLIDTDGNRYLDGVSSLWVNVHGHRKKEIDQAIIDQLKKVEHTTLLGLSNIPSIELAKKLVEITPSGLEKVFYSDSGSTACEIAIKMSYQYWQNVGELKKRKIVHLANSYHGDTLGSVSVGGIDLFHRVYRDLIFEAIKIDFPDMVRAPKGKQYPDYAFECLEKLEDLLKREHESIASLIIEPIVQGAAGMIVWPKGVLKRIEELTRKYNVLLIVDEVATGFGRTGKMFACEHEGVSPDIMCLAKGITGGYLPLAATLTTTKIYEGFKFDYKDQKTFFHGHTFTGNPLACAAALANIEIFEKDAVLAGLAPKIKYLSEQLKMFYNLPSVLNVRNFGLMTGIELVQDKETKEPYPWDQKVGVKVCQEARKRGVLLRPLGNVIVLMPPLSITLEELEHLLDVAYWAIKKNTEKNDT